MCFKMLLNASGLTRIGWEGQQLFGKSHKISTDFLTWQEMAGKGYTLTPDRMKVHGGVPLEL